MRRDIGGHKKIYVLLAAPPLLLAPYASRAVVNVAFWFLPDRDDVSPARRTSPRGRDVPTEDAAAVSADDLRLVELVRQGDVEAFEGLFRSTYNDLRRYAASLTRNIAVAEELVADAFLYVWERRAEWTVHGSVRSHLFTAVRHRALHWHRRVRLEERYAAASRELDMDVYIGVSPDQAVEWDDVVRVVRAAIDMLPPRTREAYVLHRQDALTYDDVARVMGTSPKTVEKQIGAALRTLREALKTLRM